MDVNNKLDVEHLRELAAARVERTSLRGVAREIGMSPTGLKKFLLGTAPYSPTVRRLRKWSLRILVDAPSELTYQHAKNALVVLTQDLSREARRWTADSILAVLRQGYERSETSPPRWVADLGAELGGSAPAAERDEEPRSGTSYPRSGTPRPPSSGRPGGGWSAAGFVF
jgi:hypothetical protein